MQRSIVTQLVAVVGFGEGCDGSVVSEEVGIDGEVAVEDGELVDVGSSTIIPCA